jgi:hypothetical protein
MRVLRLVDRIQRIARERRQRNSPVIVAFLRGSGLICTSKDDKSPQEKRQ